MIQAYQVPDSNKVHSHVALRWPPYFSRQCSLWHPSRPILPGSSTPGSTFEPPSAVIGSRTARGVVGTLNLTTGNGGQGQGRITRSMVDMIVFVVSALIGTMADAHKSRNCAAAR